MENRQKEAIKNITNIVQNLKLENPISQKDLSKFYTFIESEFDQKLENVENLLLKEVENKSKFQSISSLSDRLKEIAETR